MRAIKLSLCVAALAAMAVPLTAHASLGTPVGTFKLHADGSPLALRLPAGVYDITAIGTYVYDNNTTPPLLADAACSTGSDAATVSNTSWRDPVDTGAKLTATQAQISTWHRFRYGVNGDYLLTGGRLTYTQNPLDNVLNIYVNGIPGLWVATMPTPMDQPSGAVDAGCNTATHQYDTVVTSDGTTPVTLAIVDTMYADNLDMFNDGTSHVCTSAFGDPLCGLTIQVGKLAG